MISRVEAASNLQRFDGVKYGHRTEKQVDNLEEMYTQTRSEGFGQEPKLRILMGMYISATAAEKSYYQRALMARTLIRSDFEAALEKVDVLLTPNFPDHRFPDRRRVRRLLADAVRRLLYGNCQRGWRPWSVDALRLG